MIKHITVKYLPYLCLLLFPLTFGATDPVGTSVTELWKNDCNVYLEQLRECQNNCAAFNTGQLPVQKLRNSFLEVRTAYKKIEILLAYYDEEGVNDYINGAPLPKPERNASGLHFKQPAGLQVLDELIYDKDAIKNKAEIMKAINALVKKSEEIISFSINKKVQDRHLWEASRFHIIRIMSMGITGFDTPGSPNALAECRTGISTIKKYANVYAGVAQGTAAPIHQLLVQQLEKCEAYLRSNNDFKRFDRLTFIKDYLNPVYLSILALQLEMGTETYYETIKQSTPYNYLSKNLFGNDLIDATYFVNLPPSYHNDNAVELGKLLFFDPILSGNNKRSCASCHSPGKAFSDGLKKSMSYDRMGESIKRNAPGLINSIYADRFFHDLRASDFTDQIEHVVTSSQEFHTNYFEMAEKLSVSEEYKAMFAKAFPRENPSGEINRYFINAALAVYVGSLRSFNSPVDKYIRGETGQLPVNVKRGFNLFMGKANCGTCHFAPTFSGLIPPGFKESESEIIGVPGNKDFKHPVMDDDAGRYSGVLKENYEFYLRSFKTSTVRNIAFTGPYMHNGVYDSLEEVMDFYNKGGGQGLGLDVPDQTLSPEPLNLNKKEISDIIAFMRALSDTTGHTHTPAALPAFTRRPEWNDRTPGGEY